MSFEDSVLQGAQQDAGAMVKTVTYEVRRDLPRDPTVRLVFEGLLWFVFHGKDECQVGVHNTTHGPNPHGHQHDLDIRLWKIDRRGVPAGCTMYKRFHIGDPKGITGIQIDVNRPRPSTEYVY